jgi:hypothetical protein
MDIIGNGTPPRWAQRPASPGLPHQAEAGLGADGEADLDLDAEPAPAPEPVRRRPFADLVSAESFAVAALAVAFAALIGNNWTMYLLFDSLNTMQPTPQQQLRTGAISHAVPAALTLVLGVTALLRRRPDGPSWVRGVAGGAVLLGLVLGILALILLQRSSVTPDTIGSGAFDGV